MKKQLLILMLTLLSLNCLVFGKPARIAYLMPQGFTGGVIVLYNQPDGITPEVDQDNTVKYLIPSVN